MLTAGGFEDLLRALGPVAIVAMDGDQVATLADTSRVALGFDFRNASADETSNETACGTHGASAGQRCHDRPSGNQRADAGDRQRSNADEPPEDATRGSPGASTCCGAFGRLGVDF